MKHKKEIQIHVKQTYTIRFFNSFKIGFVDQGFTRFVLCSVKNTLKNLFTTHIKVLVSIDISRKELKSPFQKIVEKLNAFQFAQPQLSQSELYYFLRHNIGNLTSL